MPQAALKPCAPADPLDAAKLDHEVAESNVARLTAKIVELSQMGPGHDSTLRATLEAEREVALKQLRHADLEATELTAAAAGPISVKVIAKIRLLRRKVADSHPAAMARTAEVNSLRAHRTGLENAIAALKESSEFRADQRELKSQFVWGRDGQDGDHPPPARNGLKTPQSGKALAKLERDSDRTSAELKLAQAAQSEALEKWRNAKTTLDAWEAAIRASGPAAARALAEIPEAGVLNDQNLKGHADISLATPHALHQSQRSFGR